MKPLLILLITAGLFTSCSVHEKSYSSFYKLHKNEKGVINFSIPPLLTRLVVPNEEKGLDKFLKETSRLRVLICDEAGDKLANEISSFIDESEYHDLIYIKDGHEIVRIAAKIKNNKITEILIVVNDDQSLVSLQMEGNYSKETIKEMLKYPV